MFQRNTTLLQTKLIHFLIHPSAPVIRWLRGDPPPWWFLVLPQGLWHGQILRSVWQDNEASGASKLTFPQSQGRSAGSHLSLATEYLCGRMSQQMLMMCGLAAVLRARTRGHRPACLSTLLDTFCCWIVESVCDVSNQRVLLLIKPPIIVLVIYLVQCSIEHWIHPVLSNIFYLALQVKTASCDTQFTRDVNSANIQSRKKTRSHHRQWNRLYIPLSVITRRKLTWT